MTTTLETGVGNDTIQTSCCSCGGHKTTSIPPMQSVSNVEEEEQKQSFGSGEYLDCLEYSGPSSLNDENRMTADSGTWTASQPQNKTTANAAPFAATWAKVAAIKPTEPVSFGRSQRSATFPLSNGPARPTRKYSVARQSEPIAEQGRVVWLVNCPEKMTLREVSKKIIEGALMSVVFVDDHDEICPGRAACVIFQKAEAAQEFYEANRAVPPEGQTSKYGKGVRVEMGGNFPADEDIQSMNMFPNGARRRLTFVRSQLFVGLSRARFERDIKAIAGADNVELIHIYNTGNATVVLASVKVAKALLKHFQMYAARDGPYKDVEVSYSKDPCEAEMRLISAFMG
ncbi:hypothetical protein L228DRAFT_245382 [Xylona heveae TC161]|uniref:RRM domain-containing protein n=1 Tax=Xylona heveae (strain CBS 132557 / TC161) TaxID=1328760 RepID=A0A165I6D6_XYLHT|nr:hypothetical protein L228DRAFT_245382 [Xylona heveae TC161]KZF24451.1 hypothetical protein L228DRAFT_245382 [Xylona heveae TC161]